VLEEDWHEEDVNMKEVLMNTGWCFLFFACAESCGWASDFLAMKEVKPILEPAMRAFGANERILCYTAFVGAYVSGGIFFGWGYDVHPKWMLMIASAFTWIGYILYCINMLSTTIAGLDWRFTSIMIMAVAHVGWLVLIFANLREH
jgi:hypothetical protein